jgi:Xaa-Pro aminopeptidase
MLSSSAGNWKNASSFSRLDVGIERHWLRRCFIKLNCVDRSGKAGGAAELNSDKPPFAMRHTPIDAGLFTANREKLKQLLLPNSLAVVNANDLLPTNADAKLVMVPNSDLFYLTGIEQEETILLLAPDAHDEKHREVLFLREPSQESAIWEGRKLSKEEAAEISGVRNVRWLSDFRGMFHPLMCEAEHVYLNSNEHKRAVVEVETRDARFVRACRKKYPLHSYHRLARLMHPLRVVKSPVEIELLRRAIEATEKGFLRVAKFVKPGAMEYEVEAEFAHEFIRNRCQFAYSPIIASGANACALHYLANDQPCKRGDVLLLDVAAGYANYNADLTRVLPVGGRFTPRQKQVYRAVLRVLRASIRGATVGKLHRDWQKESQEMMNEELLGLGLLKPRDIRKQTPDVPACKKYFMHGVGHPLGLDVHDVGFLSEPFAAGWVLTVEPGIYIPEEGLGVRLENDILLTDAGPVDLMARIPIEPEEIEGLMRE